MTSNAKILEFGSITSGPSGNLVFENFRIDCAGEFHSQEEVILTTVIARLKSELAALTRVSGDPFNCAKM